MADTGIFATTAEVERKCGTNVNATAKGEAYVNDYMLQAESLINAVTRFDWTSEYTNLDSGAKGLLKEVASNLAAIYAISYDMSGFTSRIEAEDMVNILRDAALRGLSLLRDKKVKEFLDKMT